MHALKSDTAWCSSHYICHIVPADVHRMTVVVSSFSPSTGGGSLSFLCVGNMSGNMDLAAQEVKGQPGWLNGVR